ncbi:MAG: JAB domain-containing protein [Prevotella sp.]|nr:JAB domain-containing protein [Prevotella sp.]
MTRQVADALKLMRLHLADHIIVTEGKYYSYMEHGKI